MSAHEVARYLIVVFFIVHQQRHTQRGSLRPPSRRHSRSSPPCAADPAPTSAVPPRRCGHAVVTRPRARGHDIGQCRFIRAARVPLLPSRIHICSIKRRHRDKACSSCGQGQSAPAVATSDTLRTAHMPRPRVAQLQSVRRREITLERNLRSASQLQSTEHASVRSERLAHAYELAASVHPRRLSRVIAQARKPAARAALWYYISG